MKLLKIIFLTLLGLSGFVVLIIIALGAGIFRTVDDAMDLHAAEMASIVAQTQSHMQVKGNAITITLHAKPQMRVVLDGVELCNTGNGILSDTESYSSGSVNGAASTSVDFGANPMPTDLTIRRRSGAECVTQTIPDIKRYERIDGYRAVMGIGEVLGKALGIGIIGQNGVHFAYSTGASGVHTKLEGTTMELVKTERTTFSEVSQKLADHQLRLTFTYAAPPMQDEFMIGNTRVVLQFATP